MIHFGEINKKIIYPIIPIIITIFELCYSIRHFTNLYCDHVIIFKINQALSMFLSIILFIIIKKRSHIRHNQNSNARKLYSKEYNEKIRKMKIKKYILIPLTAIITFIYKILYNLVFHKIGTFFSFWIFYLLFICFFSYLILKTKYYRHQYISIITIIIFGIILNIINSLTGIDYLKLFLLLLHNILYSFNFVIKKYIIDYTFCYASELLTYEGLITLVLFIITLIISTNNEMKTNDCKYTNYNDKCYFDNYYAYYENLNKKEIFIFIIVLLYNIAYHLFFYVTMKEFSAFHIFLILIFEDGYLYDIFFNYDAPAKNIKWKLFANIIIFFILFFMLLVFTEIIEIDCFKMAKNTKRNIAKRSCTIDLGDNGPTQREDIIPYNEDNEDLSDSLVELDRFTVHIINEEIGSENSQN